MLFSSQFPSPSPHRYCFCFCFFFSHIFFGLLKHFILLINQRRAKKRKKKEKETLFTVLHSYHAEILYLEFVKLLKFFSKKKKTIFLLCFFIFFFKFIQNTSILKLKKKTRITKKKEKTSRTDWGSRVNKKKILNIFQNSNFFPSLFFFSIIYCSI